MKVKELRDLLAGLDGNKEVYLVKMVKQQFDVDARRLACVNSVRLEDDGITLEKQENEK